MRRQSKSRPYAVSLLLGCAVQDLPFGLCLDANKRPGQALTCQQRCASEHPDGGAARVAPGAAARRRAGATRVIELVGAMSGAKLLSALHVLDLQGNLHGALLEIVSAAGDR